MITIAHDSQLNGVTLEEVLDALGVKKNLTDTEKTKVCIIEDINKLTQLINTMYSRKPGRLSESEFDELYDFSVEKLHLIQSDFKKQADWVRYQHGLSGQAPIQGVDF